MQSNFKSRRLSDLLNSNNNFDILRLIASLCVLYAHEFIFREPKLHYFDNSLLNKSAVIGEIAVCFFFVLSGLLLTNSLLKNTHYFLIKRILRIFPALFLCLFVSVFVIGPLFSALSVHEFYSHPKTWLYLVGNSILNIQWVLPGVFIKGPFFNGSLWTLGYEFLCYLFLASLSRLRILNNYFLSNLICIVIIGFSIYLYPDTLPLGHPPIYAMFALGILLAINQHFIKIKLTYFFLLIFISIIFIDNKHFSYHILVFTFIYFLLWTAQFAFLKNKLPCDLSYSIYLFGLPVQFLIAEIYPNLGFMNYLLLSLLFLTPISLVSWFFIEKPAIKLGSTISNGNNLKILSKSKPNVLFYFFCIFFCFFLFGVFKIRFPSQLHIDSTNKIFSSSDVFIESYGPISNSLLEVPNIQPDGSMGLWIKLSTDLSFEFMEIIFDGKIAQHQNLQKTIFTGGIPVQWISSPGDKTIYIRDLSSGKYYFVGVFNTH